MSKYANALGIFDFTINNIKFEIKPKKGDFKQLMDLMMDNSDKKKELMHEFENFVVFILNRDLKPAGEEKEELELFIELNIMKFLEEFLIGFRLSDKDAFQKKYSELQAEKK